ncbi:MAG TPA: hypothetical protein VMY37_39985, partial [Thermoguttaceae bacterium]|nr:hypothetical protein [Thermoguttaceae bacterium]
MEVVIGLVVLFVVFVVLKAAFSAATDQSARVVEDGVERATAILEGARGGAAVVAYRNLEKTIRKQHGRREAPAVLSSMLSSIDFDPSRL